MRPGAALVVALLALLVGGAHAQCSSQPTAWPSDSLGWNCSLPAALDSVCTVRCKSGFTAAPLPSAQCVGPNTWSVTTGGCSPSCAGPPNVDIAPGGAWPPSCTSSIGSNKFCIGVCNTAAGYFGQPYVKCLGGVNGPFDVANVIGACRLGPVCHGQPAPVNAAGQPLSDGSWPVTCSDTSVGSNCTAVCRSGTVGAPAVQCVADPSNTVYGGRWAATFSESCSRQEPACTGEPPVDVPGTGGRWPAECAAGAVRAGRRCHAACEGGHGAASIACRGGGWDLASLHGRCSESPVCHGAPPDEGLLHAAMPSSCAFSDASPSLDPAGPASVCYAHCAPGFDAALPPPVSFCGPDASWTPPLGGCVEGPVQETRAFIVSPDADMLYICLLINNTLKACEANDGSAGGAPRLSQPLGVAVANGTVWISQHVAAGAADTPAGTARTHVCAFSGLRLTRCTFADLPTPDDAGGGGQVVVDSQAGLAFQAADASFGLVVCTAPATMSGCSFVASSAFRPAPVFPLGLALGLGSLWMSAYGGVWRCPLRGGGPGPTTGFDAARCAFLPTPGLAPAGLAVLEAGAPGRPGPLVVLADYEAGVLAACNASLGGCVTSGATPFTYDGDNLAPGYIGLGVAPGGAALLVPLLNGDALMACELPGVRRCSFVFADNVPRFARTSAVAVVPPGA